VLWSSVVVIGRFTTASSLPTPRDAWAAPAGEALRSVPVPG
jgi:hypothetical protein